MCIIIDANIASMIFARPSHKDFLPVLNWLQGRDGRLILFGGRLVQELFAVNGARRYLRALQQAGRAIRVSDEMVNTEETQVTATGLCKSDDPHIIALARVSGARTLCSHDIDLHKDFKNRKLISNPRGSVYQTADHIRLLRHTPSCGRGS